jgi:uncharacterized protein YndB with AHSA1/START domain
MIADNHATNTVTVSLPSEHEISLSRDFDAPRELVFEAFSKPEHVARWWGQKDSTLPVCEMDFRPGGAWRFVEHAADGNDYGFRGEYRDIVRPERITWTFEFEGAPGHIVVETMTFEDLGGRTRIIGTSVFDTVEDRDEMYNSGMARGASEAYDRLDVVLRTLA